jgi:hypothetical protein
MNNLSIIESVMIKGDLSVLPPQQKVEYYAKVCESVGLNPLTKPLEYIRLNGKEVLYATKGATEQLRNIHQISLKIVSREKIEDVYVVTAEAFGKDGRCDSATGAVAITGLKGDNLANAFMKAETKAKRRVTLSICGLNMLDESEVESIPQQAKQVATVTHIAPAQAMAEQNRQASVTNEPTGALNFDTHESMPYQSNAVLTQATVESGLCNPEYVIPIGKKYKGMMIKDVDPAELESFCNWLIKDAREKNKPLSGNAAEMVENVTAFLGSRN